MSTEAERKLKSHDHELVDLMGHLKQVSASSHSEARTDLVFEDGSALVLTSRDGADAVAEAVAPEED